MNTEDRQSYTERKPMLKTPKTNESLASASKWKNNMRSKAPMLCWIDRDLTETIRHCSWASKWCGRDGKSDRGEGARGRKCDDELTVTRAVVSKWNRLEEGRRKITRAERKGTTNALVQREQQLALRSRKASEEHKGTKAEGRNRGSWTCILSLSDGSTWLTVGPLEKGGEAVEREEGGCDLAKERKS